MKQRIIKFRAWDTKKHKMYKPVDLEWLKHGATYPDDFNPHFLWGNNMVLLQFTGLHDKNGKEIWEGDVVNVYGGMVVEYLAPEWKVRRGELTGGGDRPGFWNHVEVIGNIYENPDLLSHQKE